MSRSVLGDVALVSNGKTPPVSEQRESGFPVLKIRDVDALGNFRGPFASFVDEPFAEKFSAKHLQEGDTLILNAAHNADYVASKTFYAKSSLGGPLVTGEWTIVRPNLARADSGYVRHFIESTTAKKQLKEMVNGIHLYPKDVVRLALPLPPLPEQRRIAAILDKADALRAKRREAIAKLDQLLQSVFLDMFGDPVTNPKGWPIVELGSLISDGPQNGIYKPASDYGSGTPILRIDGFRAGDLIDGLPAKRVRLDETEVAKYQLRPADLVINRVNSPEHLGKPALIGTLSEPVVFESNMMRLTLDQGRVSPKYLLKCLLQQNIRDQISRRRKDAVNQSSINQTDVSTLTIALPPISIQEKFAAAVLACEKQRRFFASGARATDALFASMQGEAFTGAL